MGHGLLDSFLHHLIFLLLLLSGLLDLDLAAGNANGTYHAMAGACEQRSGGVCWLLLDDATAAAEVAAPWFPGSECRTWLFSSIEMNRSMPRTIREASHNAIQ
jgi:hypothetical protein